MILFKKSTDLRKYLDSQTKKQDTVGFVPTMGALHEGHLSLIKMSKKENQITVCSIFINPAQFNDPVDFKNYPETIEKDIALLNSVLCDILFLPVVDEVYPDGLNITKHYDLGTLETILEGKYRPGHFQGVCKVVHRLLEIVKPTRLYIGQKDYQQCKVITRLLELIKNEIELEIIICPTLREKDGLAMSSRNLRLNSEERKMAKTIYDTLSSIRNDIIPGKLEALKEKSYLVLQEAGFKIDYLEIADANTLETIDSWDGFQKIVTLIAASIGNVRLIDNMMTN